MSEPQLQPSSKPPCFREDAIVVLKRLRDAGHAAYFAGGCVRDELLGLHPKDYDVATDAPPKRVRELFSNTQAVGAAFGVILVRHGKSVVEVATFRTDGKYLDGRRPSEVTFTTAEEDAKRRDFTINGLFLDPLENHVIDYVGGQEDLKERVLRAIGNANERFEEDHLRLLRAVRFASRFGLSIEAGTAAAMRAHVEQLKRISPERIAEELRAMLTSPARNVAYRLLRDFRLLRIILRFMPDAVDPPGLFELVGDGTIPFGLALAALVLDAYGGTPLTTPQIRKASAGLRQALKISNEEVEQFEGSLGFAPLLDEAQPSVASMKRFLARPTSPLARALMAALGRFGRFRERIEDRLRMLGETEKTDVAPTPLLTGDDLVAAGWNPGPMFKRVLDQVYDAQLENRIATKAKALELAKQLQTPGS
jgi:tRNA nucleotidyltransferase/poly(A) polymerase